MKRNKVLSLAGLAAKAGKIASGEFPVEKAVKSGKGHLVIVAEDASDNTKKMFRDKCTFYDIPVYFYSDKENLGRAMGKQMRASAAVTDSGLASGIIKHLEESER